MKIRFRLAAIGAAAALGTGGAFAIAPPAFATDATPPVLRLPWNASFVPHTTIGPMVPDEQGELWATDSIEMQATWSATDASGVCGYSIQVVWAGSEPGPWTAWSTMKSVTNSVTDYDSQQGGGSYKFMGYNVRVRDCVNNIRERYVGFRPGVFQENGASFDYGGVTTSYSGSWRVTICQCFSAGAARTTKVAGAQLNSMTDYPQSHPVALVMEKARGRGRAQVLVDGRLVATIDTLASAPVHRSVIWAGNVPAGVHTVSVVNPATSGRPRIDVDAFMVSGLDA
jgi:hypothetical protein